MAEIRILAGQWRRWRIEVADEPGCRPTPERLRETLFNWLGQDLTDWRMLDAFAGSGALGFEALSRGASEVIWLDANPNVVRRLKDNYQRLLAMSMKQALLVGKAHVVTGDALRWLEQSAADQTFDLICLDPPYASDLLLKALPLAATCVKTGGWLFLESDQQRLVEFNRTMLPDGREFAEVFTMRRETKVGQARAWLFQKTF